MPSTPTFRFRQAEGVSSRVEKDTPRFARLMVGERGAEFNCGGCGSVEIGNREIEVELFAAVRIRPVRRNIVFDASEAERAARPLEHGVVLFRVDDAPAQER
mgnify:CR=1 FL=1